MCVVRAPHLSGVNVDVMRLSSSISVHVDQR